MKIILLRAKDTLTVLTALHRFEQGMPTLMDMVYDSGHGMRHVDGRVVAAHPEIHALSILVLTEKNMKGEITYQQVGAY